ncbi:MAG: hypothetical protein GY705_14255 [Bacteroidetes bacterium]|nr:hypothetical protein [Bacteroidota bacterium]
MIEIGPSKFILINSGKYGYGEIIVNKPVQLVGANNVGKTTLINALQFLMIDDEKQMSFPKSLKETKSFYFRDTYSYVLLEIITPTGYRVLGAHGMGPIKNNNIERFAFEGEFQREMFIRKDNTIREFDTIKVKLAAKKFTTLEPRHLKAALTGVGESKGVSLGLVPLRDNNHFSSFQSIFKNLLHLNSLRQDELKTVLLKVFKNDFSLDHIDLTSSYNDRFREISSQRESIQVLEKVSPMVFDAGNLIDRQKILRGKLPVIFKFIEDALQAEDRRHRELIDAFSKDTEKLSEELENLQCELSDKRKQEKNYHLDLGGVNKDINRIEVLERKFVAFSPELTKVSLDNQEKKKNDLIVKLKTASLDDPERLKVLIREKKELIKKDERLLNQNKDLLITHLKRLFSDSQIDLLFTLLNPEMLHLIEGEDGFEIKDQTILVERFNILLGNVNQQRQYNDSAVNVMLRTMKSPHASDFMDRAIITKRLHEKEADVSEWRIRLESAQKAAELQHEKGLLDADCRKLQKKFNEYEAFLEEQKQMPEWEKNKLELGEKLGILGKAISETGRLIGEIEKDKNAIYQKKQDGKRHYTQLVQNVQSLTPPPLGWERKVPEDIEIKEISDLIQDYRYDSNEEHMLSQKIENCVLQIMRETSGQYGRGDDQQTIQCLSEELEGLEEKIKANDHDWQDLVAGFGNSFKELNNSYEALKSKITALNRQLGKISISNINRLQLTVADNHKWVDKIKQIAINYESPLFRDLNAQEKIYAEFSDILKNIPSLYLKDLFTLHFTVETPDGHTTTYPDLDTIESNGTTITIKILVNLILLRSLFGKRNFRIPYYLDEAPNLSSKNLQAIIQVSDSLGFTPILAGTIPIDAADIFYFMKQNQGKIWMKPHERMEVQRSLSEIES